MMALKLRTAQWIAVSVAHAAALAELTPPKERRLVRQALTRWNRGRSAAMAISDAYKAARLSTWRS
jgi:hypothetical protein